MSRPHRFERPGLIYHVMGRGNNKMPLYLDDLDHEQFLSLLGDAAHRFEADVWTYCLMRNHYHLVVRTRRANLSHFEQWLNGGFAAWWNRRHRHVGHVFQGRYKSQVVESGDSLLRVTRYVLRNPVRAGLSDRVAGWRWTGLAPRTRRTPEVDVDGLLAALHLNRHRGWRTHLTDGADDDEIANLVRRDRRIIGSEAFQRQFRAEAATASSEVPRRERRIGIAPIAAVLAAALSEGRGLTGGVRDAADAGYGPGEIGEQAGLSRHVIARLLKRGAIDAPRQDVRGRRAKAADAG